MPVTIRFARHGRKKEPFYRVVVADKEMPRDGRFLELVGTVNPLTEPATVLLKEDRIKHWIGVGARPSQTVAEVIMKAIPGLWEEKENARLEKIKQARAKRKARAKKQ